MAPMSTRCSAKYAECRTRESRAFFALYTVCSLGALILGTAAAVLAKNIAIARSGRSFWQYCFCWVCAERCNANDGATLVLLAILFLVYGFARGLCSWAWRARGERHPKRHKHEI